MNIQNYKTLVNSAVNSLPQSRFSSSHREDMIQDGYIGLLDALEKYESDGNASFETYAFIRIKGAIIDGLRRLDWAPRELRKRARTLCSSRQTQLQMYGNTKASDISSMMGISIEDYYKLDAGNYTSTSSYVDEEYLECVVDSTNVDPASTYENKELISLLITKLQNLPIRDRKIWQMREYQEMTLKEIAEEFGVTEARIKQITNEIVIKLRKQLAFLDS